MIHMEANPAGQNSGSKVDIDIFLAFTDTEGFSSQKVALSLERWNAH